ncbi:hypothetical protein GH714_028473 [Hevea brasiliensis]|uniref:DWNN domain-containing protein n=1 Tax=Hevea brasiliensis TaxID=3981 RepID=A0A6A6LUL2_HEVBR|nr:hypothetical protein GH714_028473 [Hevea brasiliensis]
MDVESAHCSQPQISTTKLPAGSFQESKKTTLYNIEGEANKRKLLDDPYQIAKKARTTRAADVSEATIGSTRMKDTASQGSVLVIEEDVQREVVSSDGGKNRNVAEDEVQQKLVFSKGGKKKRGIKNSEDDSHSFLMPVGSYAYNPYWAGVQVGMEGYVAPYYAARAMNYGAKEYDSISVDGSVISVDALKRKIFEYKYKSNMKSHSNGLCFGTDLDLVVINAQTNDCYVDDMLIPNNTRVLIRRIPGTRRGKPIDAATIVVIEKQQPLSSSYRTGSCNTETVVTASSRSTPVNTGVSSVSASAITSLSSTKCSGDASFGYDDGFGDDVFVIPRMKPAQSSMTSVDVESDEDSKIKALVNTPALDWQLEGSIGVGSRTQGVNGRGCGRMDGHSFGGLWKKTPPEGYICNRCKVPGHFIQYCPTNGDPNYDFKRPNDDAFKKEIFGCFPSKRSWSVSDLPPELLCPLCKQVMKDAALTSKCCFKSFCDKCIRDHLIISKLKCECGAANVLADSLIPNMTLRDTINCFVESSCGNSSSGENAKSNSFRVMDVESAHCSQPQISTKKLPAGSFKESKKTTLDNSRRRGK